MNEIPIPDSYLRAVEAMEHVRGRALTESEKQMLREMDYVQRHEIDLMPHHRRAGTIYVIRVNKEGFKGLYKIGCTEDAEDDWEERMAEIQEIWGEFEIICLIPTDDVYRLRDHLYRQYAKFHFGNILLTLSPAQLNSIKSTQMRNRTIDPYSPLGCNKTLSCL